MEFSRRGPASTGGADGGRRFPDPPSQGERDPMLVTRDALLSQLHMACLRQEIVEAELAKVEHAVALRAAAAGNQTETAPMPMSMPWHGVATPDAGRSQPWPFSAVAEQLAAQQSSEFDEHKVPDSNKDALLSQLHMARLRQKIIQDEVAQIERAMVLRTATSGHQTQTTPMPMPWQGVATADAGRSKAGPFSADQPVMQQNTEFDDRKLPDSNESVPLSKSSSAEKSELMGSTILVKDLKPPMKWNCTVCQVQATSEQDLHRHYAGQKHLSNVATLDPTTRATNQKAKAAAELSLCTEQKKASSIKWSCTTCQANGTSQSTLESHLKGKRHQQNIAATSVEGEEHGIPKNVVAQEAKSHSINAPKHSEPSIGTEQKKTSSIKWSCSTCQANGTSQSTFESHLKGKRHQQNIAVTSIEGNKNGIPKNVVAQEAESHGINVLKHSEKPTSAWSCSICQVICTCQTDLKNHLRGIKHQEKVQSLLEQSKNKAKKCNSEWNCPICEAKCNSKPQFEGHCRTNRHQQKVHAILGKGKIVKASSSRTANELALDGSNGKNASSEMEEQPALYFCEVCNLLCESSTMLAHHRFGKKHRTKVSASK